jgi:hypothetical protein
MADSDDSYEVKKAEFVNGQFKVCPQCGYKDGFHNMFREEGEETKWYFICPDCRGVFDIGYIAPRCFP